MGSTALDGASKYLNNLLLARGFLQDGKPIDFGSLSSNPDKKAVPDACDRYGTTTTIINLIHDLVLRRDRDAEQREALAATIRTIRAEESQRLLDFQKLQDKNVQLRSDLSTAEAQQRTHTIAMKKAQAETRDLREQALKMKSTLDQVRAKCISDVRKRDIELDKLKTHLSAMNRGKKESVTGGMKVNTLNIQQRSRVGKELRGGQEVNNSTDWTLENETNDFLAAVVNETSTENVALRKIVGDSMNYLRSLTGLDEQERQMELAQQQSIAEGKSIGIPGQYRERTVNASSNSAHSDSLIPVQSLAASMSEVLSHCQSILRDPSFVPIEEVQIRDEEIQKLRVGWEKMADRWKEAVSMMSQWRQTTMGETQEHGNGGYINTDNTFNAEELPEMAAFGRSVAVRPDGQPVLDAIEEEELTSMLLDHHSRLMSNQSVLSNEQDEEEEEEEEEQEEQEQLSIHDESVAEPDDAGTPRQQSFHIQTDHSLEDEESDLHLEDKPQAAPQFIASPARRGIKIWKSPSPSPARQPLTTANANSKKRKNNSTSPSPRKRRSISSPINTLSTSNTPSLTISTTDSNNTTDPLDLDNPSDTDDEDDADPFLAEELKSESTTIPRMTVAQKLAAIEAEASEATEVIRRRQATTYDASTDRRARGRAEGKSTKTVAVETEGKRDRSGKRSGDMQSGSSEPRNKEQRKKVRDRRRSTLTPGELGGLMGR